MPKNIRPMLVLPIKNCNERNTIKSELSLQIHFPTLIDKFRYYNRTKLFKLDSTSKKLKLVKRCLYDDHYHVHIICKLKLFIQLKVVSLS